MSMLNTQLTSLQLTGLRDKGLIEQEEIAFIAGDLLIAENSITSSRRVIGNATVLSEVSNKRVLKG